MNIAGTVETLRSDLTEDRDCGLIPARQATYDAVRAALETCEGLVDSAHASLEAGNSDAAELPFRKAEELFEEAQEYLRELSHEERRRDLQAILGGLGLKLDSVWVRLMSHGIPRGN